jgi:CheY-like chemotaxis protein
MLQTEDIDRRLTAEYLDEAQDVLNELDVRLGNARTNPAQAPELLDQMGRQYHSLRLGAKGAGLPAVDLIMHRLLDYTRDLTALSDKSIDDIQIFHDRIRRALDGKTEGDDTRTMVRSLPVKHGFDVADVKILDIEIMLVEPNRATRRIFERELQACGYRVSNVARSVEAIELVFRTRPDMVICSAVLDEMTGIDVTCALTAMPATSNIPVALLTSYGFGHPSLERLPARVAIIRKGHRFGDDLAEALARFNIT